MNKQTAPGPLYIPPQLPLLFLENSCLSTGFPFNCYFTEKTPLTVFYRLNYVPNLLPQHTKGLPYFYQILLGFSVQCLCPLLPRPVMYSVLSLLPRTVIGKKAVEPEKVRRKNGQEVDFYWKQQKRNKQCVRSAKGDEPIIRGEIR